MRNELVLDLADCTEFRQTLQARPPRIVHGTLSCSWPCSTTALGWSAATQADLVVRAPGRVRPVTTPMKVFNAARGEVLSASVGGPGRRGQCARGTGGPTGRRADPAGPERLDNEIAKQAAGDPGRRG